MVASPAVVEEVLALCGEAARANQHCAGRRGSVIWLTPETADEVMIVADLHGNRLNYRKILQLADLARHPRRHLVMQEVCHGGPEYPGDNGGCMSHLLLEDCIRLKTQYPDQFHFLLSNHEMAELADHPICKGRKILNLLFRWGLKTMYGDQAERVREAYLSFLRTCPLAVRTSDGVFISHSCPEHCDLVPFDPSVLERPLTSDDYRHGMPAFQMVWGRDFRRTNAEAFARQVGARILVQGHEPCARGYSTPNPHQIILDGCGPYASYLILPVGQALSQEEIVQRIRRLHPPTTAQAVS
jgi:hypothetical protein